MVFCRKYQKELEGLDAPPLPGKRGQDIYETVSKQAWAEWQKHQTMLINEKHLSLVNPEARKYLAEQMEKFLQQRRRGDRRRLRAADANPDARRLDAPGVSRFNTALSRWAPTKPAPSSESTQVDLPVLSARPGSSVGRAAD